MGDWCAEHLDEGGKTRERAIDTLHVYIHQKAKGRA